MKPNVTISVEFETLSAANLILAEHADVIFVSKDYANLIGFTSKESAVYGMQKQKIKKE